MLPLGFFCNRYGSTGALRGVVYCYLGWFDYEVDIQESFYFLGAVVLLEVRHLVDQNDLLPVGIKLFSAIERRGWRAGERKR